MMTTYHRNLVAALAAWQSEFNLGDEQAARLLGIAPTSLARVHAGDLTTRYVITLHSRIAFARDTMRRCRCVARWPFAVQPGRFMPPIHGE
jgi:hypothetical protein